MTTMADRVQIEDNNRILFARLAVKLNTGDLDVYAKSAGKLASWLSEDRAYYPEARRQIIRLLLIAQTRAREVMGFQNMDAPFDTSQYSDNPFVIQYVKLVETIKPFRHHFAGEAQNIVDAFASIIATVSPPTSSTQPQAQPNISNPTLLVPPDKKADVDASNIPPPHQEEREGTQETTVVQEQSQSTDASILDSGAEVSTEAKRGQLESKKQQLNNPTLSSSNVQSTSTPAVPQQTRKAKKRKTFDMLVKFDQEDLLRRKALTAQTQPRESGVVAHQQEVSASSLSTTTLSSAKIPSPGPHLAVGRHPPANIDKNTHIGGDPMAGVVDGISKVQTQLGGSAPLQPDGMAAAMEKCQIIDQRPDAEDSSHMETNDKTGMPTSTQTQSTLSAPPIENMSEDLGLLPDEGTLGTFGLDMRVMARQYGMKNKTRISVSFDIPEAQFNLVKLWVHRQGTILDLKSSICMTFGCYLLEDLTAQSQKPDLETFEKQVSCTPVIWPQKPGVLSVEVLGSGENLPLSPPFHVTPDNLVDISGLLVQGKNNMQLRQHDDLQNYMFILHAHHPTRRQLQQVLDHRQKDKEWRLFLAEASAPLPYISLKDLKAKHLQDR